jgi:ribonuclease D
LNLIYRVLKRKLDPQAQIQLAAEERKWIEDREKAKNDPNSGWDATTHDRINWLAEQVLQ